MFSERLSSIYTSLEEKYYSLLDFLDGKGIPVYSYNDFLEGKGLPAFPITVALLVLLVAGAYGLLFVGSSVNTEITISFFDQFEESVSGVTVTVKDSSGNLVASPQKVANGGSITLQGIPLGTELALVAEKNGFKAAEQIVPVTKERISAAISMERKIEAIVGKIQLVDSDTGDPIRNAVVTAEWMGQTKSETTDSEGKASFAGIPANMDVLVRVQADGYETLTGNYSFLDEELKGVSLVASSASFAGISKLVVSVLDEEGSPVKGPKVIVWDRETDTSVEERTIEGSEIVFSIPKGTSTRLIVQKEGFLKYDSLDYDESRTMRQDEEQWPVVLEKGGTRLVVTVFAGQTPLGDATIQLFDLNGNLLGVDVTGFGGTVEFTGLKPEQVYVTAYKQGFLPAREKVSVAETETMSLVVESADSANSSYLGISVLDSYKAMANNADLSFSEKVAGQLFPLGIPSLKTDVSGYASIVAKTGTLAVVEAQKEMQLGYGEKLVEANKDNQMVIELSKPVDVVELQVLDSEGNAAAGQVVVESVTGELLFDGPISQGRIFFDSEGNKEAIVKVETADGETFSQRILVEGKETVQVNLGEAAVGIAPTIAFTGVFDQFGEAVEGITPGENYWLGFQTTWPSGVEKGGVHVRLGQDGVAFVDSQQAGITGFEATSSSYFYGKSYQPLPSPGNETADKQNAGIAGQPNKLVELYFEQPENTVVVRVRVKANDFISAEEIEVHYRAWSEAGGKFFRTPLDSELGEELFTETKTSLYAADEKETVKVFASGARCEEQLCGNYFFVMPNGLYVERQLFKAVTEEVYALEIDLSAKKPLNITLKLDTDKASPKIQFTGYDVDDFVDQQQEALPAGTDLSGQGYLEWGSGSEEAQSASNPLGFKQQGEIPSITVTGLGVSPERSRKVRVYFRAVAEGKAEIKMQAASESVLNENFVFEVERNKPLMVSVSPREIEIGEPFTVKVLDAENGDAVQDATVQIRDGKGNIVASISGTGSTRKGLLGEYNFKNGLDPGFYHLVVSVAGYKGYETELAIARHDLLSIVGPFTIEIPEESREKTFSFSIRNDAKQEVTGIGYELERDASFPQEFAVSVSLPASVSEDQDVTGTIRVIVNLDEESEDSLYGEATLVLKGMAAGNYPIKTDVRLKISYNKPLQEECLYFDKQHLLARINGRAGSSATEEFEVENKCGATLNLKATVEEKQLDPNISVSVQSLRIEDGAVEKVKVSVSNRIERMYDMQRREFTILFESSQIAKTIPLTVELSSPMTNLSYPPSIALWMVRSAAEELAYAQSPVQVMNMGAVPVTAFRAVPSVEAYVSGITVGIKPSGVAGLTLYPGMPLTPQRFVYAETRRTEAMQRPGQGYIQFSGIVGGRQRPDLGRVNLSFNYSGIKCLEAKPVDEMYFSSKEAGQGTLERTIIVKNNCGEPVRLSGNLKPAKISGNTFVLSPPITLNPGQQQEVKLILMKSQETNRAATIKVLGLLTMQNKWIESNEIQVTVKLGLLEATPEGKHTAEISIDECDSDTPKRIAFPILSSDCGNGYCDAKQLAEYLVEEMDTLVKMAEDKASRANRNAEKFGNCADKSYCRFERDMGIISDAFPVFMQLDFMTEEVLGKALEESSKLKGYIVLQGAKRVEDIGEAGFDFGDVHLGGQFKGCGKYYVEIVGAIRVENAEIMVGDKRNFMLSVNIVQSRADTDECLHRVENVANFLPVDEGFTIERNYRAWPGFVKAGPELKELAEAFAKELFGKAEGRYSSSISANSNKLEIVKGDTKGGLLKVRIDESGKPDIPKTVYVHVPSSYSKEDKQMTAEIAKALKSFKANDLGDDACWGQDDEGQYIVMKSYKDIDKLYGKLQIQGMQSIRINNQLQCIDLNISSKAPEIVTFTTDFSKKPSKTGIEYVVIKDSQDKVLLQENANGGNKVAGKEMKLKEEKGKPGVYSAGFKFCVKGDNMFPLAVETVGSVGITGHGSATPDRKTSPHKVAVEACGMHPYDLVKKMASVELKQEDEDKKKLVAYVTVSWKDGPEKVSIAEIDKAIAAEAAMDEAMKRYGAGENVHIAEQPAYMAEMGQRRLIGTWAFYALPCSITAAGLNWWNGATKAAFYDIPFTCVGPALWASKNIVKDYGGSWEDVAEGVDYMVREIFSIIPLVGDQLADTIVPQGDDIGSEPTREEAFEKAQSFKENIMWPAATGLSTRAILSSISNGGELVTKLSAKAAADEASDYMMQEMIRQNLRGMGTDEVMQLIGGTYDKGVFKPSIPGTPSGRLRNLLSNKVESNLLVHEGRKQIAEAITDPDLKVIENAISETGESVSAYAAGHIDDFQGATGAHNLAKAQQDDALRALMDPLRVEAPTGLERTVTLQTKPYDPATVTRRPTVSIKGHKDMIKGGWERKTVDQIEIQLSATEDGRKLLADPDFWDTSGTRPNSVQRVVKSQTSEIDSMITKVSSSSRPISQAIPEVIDPRTGRVLRPAVPAQYVDDVIYAVDVDGVVSLTRKTAVEAQKRAAKAYTTGLIGKKSSAEVVKGIVGGDDARGLITSADDIAGKIRPSATTASRNARFKDAVKGFFSKRFWNTKNLLNITKNLGKGLAMGVIEAGMGYLVWDSYWDAISEAEVKGGERAVVTPSKVADMDGDGKITEADYLSLASQELWKGQTYRLQITEDPDGRIYRFTMLEDEEDFEEMNQDLAEGKAELWEEPGCKNFLQKTITQYMGNLGPVPAKGIDSGHVVAYYNHNSLFADAARGDENPADDLLEDRLVSVLFVEPGRIEGCSIPKEWYRRGKDEAPENAKARAKKSIGCAAKQLRKAGGSEGSGKSFRAVVEELVKGQEKTENYVGLVLDMQRKWEKF